MSENQVIPAVQGNQTIRCREIYPNLPLLIRNSRCFYWKGHLLNLLRTLRLDQLRYATCPPVCAANPAPVMIDCTALEFRKVARKLSSVTLSAHDLIISAAIRNDSREPSSLPLRAFKR